MAKMESPVAHYEKMYGPYAKLLIVHGDDLGAAHAINQATCDALDMRKLSSASVMVPCPWFSEAAAYAATYPDQDIGIHLTLTSEWAHHRWRPRCSRDQVPTLCDEEGFLWSTVDSVTQARAAEVDIELRGQIDYAQQCGISPSHLDCHMDVLLRTPAFLSVYRQIARDYDMPFRAPFGRRFALPFAVNALLPPPKQFDPRSYCGLCAFAQFDEAGCN